MEFWPVVLLAGIIAILFAAWLARDVLSEDKGTKAMQEVASLIFEGAMAFLNRQYRTIAVLAIVAAVIIGVLIGGLANDPQHGLRSSIAFQGSQVRAVLRPCHSRSSALASARRSWRCSLSWAAASTPRLLTWALTWSARSKRASLRTIRATPPSWRTWSGTTWVTAPAAVPTCSSRRPPKIL